MARSDAGARGHPSRLALSAFTRVCDALWLAPQDEVRWCRYLLLTRRKRGSFVAFVTACCVSRDGDFMTAIRNARLFVSLALSAALLADAVHAAGTCPEEQA